MRFFFWFLVFFLSVQCNAAQLKFILHSGNSKLPKIVHVLDAENPVLDFSNIENIELFQKKDIYVSEFDTQGKNWMLVWYDNGIFDCEVIDGSQNLTIEKNTTQQKKRQQVHITIRDNFQKLYISPLFHKKPLYFQLIADQIKEGNDQFNTVLRFSDSVILNVKAVGKQEEIQQVIVKDAPVRIGFYRNNTDKYISFLLIMITAVAAFIFSYKKIAFISLFKGEQQRFFSQIPLYVLYIFGIWVGMVKSDFLLQRNPGFFYNMIREYWAFDVIHYLSIHDLVLILLSGVAVGFIYIIFMEKMNFPSSVICILVVCSLFFTAFKTRFHYGDAARGFFKHQPGAHFIYRATEFMGNISRRLSEQEITAMVSFVSGILCIGVIALFISSIKPAIHKTAGFVMFFLSGGLMLLCSWHIETSTITMLFFLMFFVSSWWSIEKGSPITPVIIAVCASIVHISGFCLIPAALYVCIVSSGSRKIRILSAVASVISVFISAHYFYSLSLFSTLTELISSRTEMLEISRIGLSIYTVPDFYSFAERSIVTGLFNFTAFTLGISAVCALYVLIYMWREKKTRKIAGMYGIFIFSYFIPLFFITAKDITNNSWHTFAPAAVVLLLPAVYGIFNLNRMKKRVFVLSASPFMILNCAVILWHSGTFEMGRPDSTTCWDEEVYKSSENILFRQRIFDALATSSSVTQGTADVYAGYLNNRWFDSVNRDKAADSIFADIYATRRSRRYFIEQFADIFDEELRRWKGTGRYNHERVFAAFDEKDFEIHLYALELLKEIGGITENEWQKLAFVSRYWPEPVLKSYAELKARWKHKN